MLTRRESLLGGLLTLIYGATGCACGAHADSDLEGGCVVDDEQAEFLFARGTPAQSVLRGTQKMIKSSGDSDLDYAIGRTLSRLSQTFNVSASFTYYEGENELNAFATTRKMIQGTDGTVAFGIRYLKSKLKQPEAPDAWVAATLAHEFGHILGFKHDLRKQLPNNPTVKRFELHADFMAGFYAGCMKKRNPEFPAAIFAASRHASGGFKRESLKFHGTPEERANAAIRGFETAYREGRPLGEAIQIGVRYAKVL